MILVSFSSLATLAVSWGGAEVGSIKLEVRGRRGLYNHGDEPGLSRQKTAN